MNNEQSKKHSQNILWTSQHISTQLLHALCLVIGECPSGAPRCDLRWKKDRYLGCHWCFWGTEQILLSDQLICQKAQCFLYFFFTFFIMFGWNNPVGPVSTQPFTSGFQKKNGNPQVTSGDRWTCSLGSKLRWSPSMKHGRKLRTCYGNPEVSRLEIIYRC